MFDNYPAAQRAYDKMLPPEYPHDVECCMCHCGIDAGEVITIGDDTVCNDCFADYCINNYEKYAEEYIAGDYETLHDFIKYVSSGAYSDVVQDFLRARQTDFSQTVRCYYANA
ncbi:hypothetical protein [Caproicibacterium amylolyticum]|uniref:Uncharacterized protein n=1 Tax=Caproicibacterium amylolyticum TaxID=2766537 RepID=A0A7G9WJH1_9FIRM|nr:hypothetical protein [Caproicibacterium amylolyticum]QNO18833.1 hypothetical protein H6X83_04140 [Caproicibacterium amylolyticum]